MNRKTKRDNDSLGRLIKVTEQDVTTGNLTQETTYTYDIADHLTGVNQGNQTRAFKYDAQGHLLFERIPEMTATINDGTGTYWTTKYTYTDFGSIATKTDARGVIITYGYDTLNRLTSISYNTSGATGVDSTNNVAYNYDTSQTSATDGLLLSISMTGPMATYTETLSYDTSKRVGSRAWTRDSLSYTTSYQYNTANRMTQMTYPGTGRTLNVAHDSTGRVSSIADQYRTYANNFTFNPAGQVTGLNLGNVATETYGYDTNRMQLVSQTATQNGGSTNGLMNLHYYYDAAAGQMGAGSTAGNAGQLMAINNSSTINGTTESAAYTYDDLRRLVTSNQTSNGSSAQRRFSCDRWGNRTGMWDATSGGTQVQSISLQQSGGVPTNQMASVTASGVTKNCSYDANGNLINDGAHIYTYDGENRLRTVDWGNANQASYVYDYANRRIKKYTNAAITYYVWEGSQVIGECDSNGGTICNYVYSGSRLIARIGSGVVNWYLSDRLSERLVLDGSGNVIGRMAHLPFGEDFGESGTQEKHHFTSYESDSESGTDYAVNRQYSQSVGRFMRIDPLAGSLGDPQSLDRYSYVKNDPIQLTDPLGLEDGFLPGIGSSAGLNWQLFLSLIFGGMFPANINSPPDPVPAIPVASIPSDFFGKWNAQKCGALADRLLVEANKILSYRTAVQVFLDVNVNDEIGSLFMEDAARNVDDYEKNDSLGSDYLDIRSSFYNIGKLGRETLLNPNHGNPMLLNVFNRDASDARKSYEDNRKLASTIDTNCVHTARVEQALTRFKVGGFIGSALEALAGVPFS